MSNRKHLSEEERAKNEWILDGFRNNQQKVIKACYQEIYPMVVHLVVGNGGTKMDARSLLHDALMVFHKKCQEPHFELTAKFSSYLYAICRFQWMRKLAKRKRNVLEYLDLLTEVNEKGTNEISHYVFEQYIEENLHAQQLIKWIDELLENAKPLYQRILKLYVRGQSHQEIANILQITEGTSRKTLNHCRLFLAQKIKESPHFKEMLSDSSTKSFLKKYLKHLVWLVFLI